MELLDRLLDHDDWATAQLLDLSRGLTDAQLDQPFDIGHRSLRATFDHMILNVDFWTGVMVGQPIEYKRDASSVATLIEDHKRSSRPSQPSRAGSATSSASTTPSSTTTACP